MKDLEMWQIILLIVAVFFAVEVTALPIELALGVPLVNR